LDLLRVSRQLKNHLHRALRNTEFGPFRSSDDRLRPFVNRIKGLEVDHLVFVQLVPVFQTAQNRDVNGILTLSARGECGGEDHLRRLYAAHRE
jgi:hypothetical protein